MKSKTGKAICTLVFMIIVLPCRGYCQRYSSLYLNSRFDPIVSYLVLSDQVRLQHPLFQPLTTAEILGSIDSASVTGKNHWLQLLKTDVEKFGPLNDSLSVKGKIILGAEGLAAGSLLSGKPESRIAGNLIAGYTYKGFQFFHRYRMDENYLHDTLYFGATGKLMQPVFGRTSESLLQWSNKSIRLFIGRLGHNLGLIDEPSLILSMNPFSYDQVGMAFTSSFLRFTTTFGRLEDKVSYDIRDTSINPSLSKRFLSVHRLEMSILKNLKIGLTESILFGGTDDIPMFQYLNPANLFFFSKMSDRKGYEERNSNPIIALEVLYKPLKPLTLFTQLMIDDMDVVKTLREKYPDRVGITAKAIYTDPFQGSQVSFTFTRISNWTYNSFYTWGNYTYYGKSLGYPGNGVERYCMSLDVFRFAPFIMKLNLIIESQRAQDLEAAFVAVKSEFPIGIPEKSLGIQFNATYFPKSWVNVIANVEACQVQNFENINGNQKSYLNFRLGVSFYGITEIVR